jgi:RNA polymerase sigma factor (sigma-70 family)
LSNTTNNRNSYDLPAQHKELILACIKGDRHSQNQLYELFEGRMFGLCMRYAKNKEEAEDIMQEGFIQVFRSMNKFKFEGSFDGWVRRIMVNCALQQYRATSKIHAIVSLETSYTEQVSNEEIISRIQTKELLKMIQQLSPAYRMIFNLHVFEGMKHREIAVALGISEGTSKSNFFDAKQILQKTVTKSLEISNNY